MSFFPTDGPIVVLGATGQVGTAIRRTRLDARFLSREDADLYDIRTLPEAIEAHRPSAIINCAAFTDVDSAEDAEEVAVRVNGEAVGVLAEVAADASIPFVTFSTDYVFDGTATSPYVESAAVNPLGVYGESKLLGERLALERYDRTLIIRTSWLVSETNDNFVLAILRRAREGSVRVVNDQMGLPTIASDLAVSTIEALQSDLQGIVHLANRGVTTWYELAAEILRLAGYGSDLVEPCSSEEYPTKAKRPRYSVLGTERADTPTLPGWRESLPSVVAAQQRRLARMHPG